MIIVIWATLHNFNQSNLINELIQFETLKREEESPVAIDHHRKVTMTSTAAMRTYLRHSWAPSRPPVPPRLSPWRRWPLHTTLRPPNLNSLVQSLSQSFRVNWLNFNRFDQMNLLEGESMKCEGVSVENCLFLPVSSTSLGSSCCCCCLIPNFSWSIMNSSRSFFL